MLDALSHSIEGLLGEEVTGISAITNSLSGRNYYRVTTPEGRLIVSQTPPSQQAEFDNFLAIHPLLAGGGVRVPQLIAVDHERLLLAQEDFGGNSLSHLSKPDPDPQLYDKVLDELVKMQAIKGTVPIMVQRTFDTQGILNEYEWVVERFLVNGFLDQKLSPSQLDQMKEYYTDLAYAIGEHPRVFCHRDFQSSNVMVKDGEVGVIDFQGARLATPLYDLVSLLEDVYTPLSADFKDHLKFSYRKKALLAQIPLPSNFGRSYQEVFIQRRFQNAAVFANACKPEPVSPWKEHLQTCLADLDQVLGPKGIKLSA